MKLFNLTIFISICMIFLSTAGLSFYKSTVAAGFEHTILIDEDGQAWAVGNNNFGRLGLGDNKARNSLQKITIENQPELCFQFAAAGADHTILIDEEGKAWAAGGNYCGQLGLGDYENRNTFQQIIIENHPELRFHFAAVGADYTILIDKKGQVWAAGSNTYGQLGLENVNSQNSFQQVIIENQPNISFNFAAAGADHTILIDEEGKAWVAGDNSCDQLGLEDYKDGNTFQQITIENQHDIRFVFAAAGDKHTILMDHDEQVWAVGKNYYGQLGLGDNEDRKTFQSITIENLHNTHFTFITTGAEYTILIDHRGQAWSAGNDKSGELGLGNQIDRCVFQQITIENQHNTRFIFTTAGTNHTILIDENRFAWAVGDNNYGQLGLEDNGDISTLEKIMVDGQPLQVMSPFQKTRVKSAKSDEY